MLQSGFLCTFCFVWFPAPGHSVMMSSLASVFVAKAKATPEKVVPCASISNCAAQMYGWRHSRSRFQQSTVPCSYCCLAPLTHEEVRRTAVEAVRGSSAAVRHTLRRTAREVQEDSLAAAVVHHGEGSLDVAAGRAVQGMHPC